VVVAPLEHLREESLHAPGRSGGRRVDEAERRLRRLLRRRESIVLGGLRNRRHLSIPFRGRGWTCRESWRQNGKTGVTGVKQRRSGIGDRPFYIRLLYPELEWVKHCGLREPTSSRRVFRAVPSSMGRRTGNQRKERRCCCWFFWRSSRSSLSASASPFTGCSSSPSCWRCCG